LEGGSSGKTGPNCRDDLSEWGQKWAEREWVVTVQGFCCVKALDEGDP